MITVVCLSVGNAFHPRYVSRLYDGIKRHTKRAFEFVCICDGKNASKIREAMPYGTINLHIISEAEYPKWWGKMTIFQPAFQEFIGTDILFFDLDTIITGPISPLLTLGYHCQTDLAILRNFLQPPLRNPKVVPCEYGSAVMWVRRGKMQEIYKNFKQLINFQEKYDNAGGDQKFIEDVANKNNVCFLQDELNHFSNEFFRSVKYPTPLTQVPVGTSVICYHGKPRPHEDQTNQIVANHWI